MVKPREELLDWSIKNTKMRIKHHEVHGKGSVVIKEKAQLKKQERIKELRNALRT